MASVDKEYFKLHSQCEQHNLDCNIVVGKLTRTVYWIPITSRVSIFAICPKCQSSYEELKEEAANNILNAYNGKIDFGSAKKKIALLSKKEQDAQLVRAAKDESDAVFFLKVAPLFILVLVLAYVIKRIFFS